eukprot:TRINITY_DN35538_c0_g1_i1.p2 TRINITY_DN35538_c0_g1~~TRINITY_DN35538_c0_g1_i1.p2  ORF type:complete len:225 (+),score=66.04 TRINITY_DN35538_c0_g1_i1:100-675(+)
MLRPKKSMGRKPSDAGMAKATDASTTSKKDKKEPLSRPTPPPLEVALEGSSNSDPSDDLEDLLDCRESGWCNDKLFSDYKAFLSSSRVLRESWEKGSSLVDELGASVTDPATSGTFDLSEFILSPTKTTAPPQTKRVTRKFSDPTMSSSNHTSGPSPKAGTRRGVTSRVRAPPMRTALRPCSPGVSVHESL